MNEYELSEAGAKALVARQMRVQAVLFLMVVLVATWSSLRDPGSVSLTFLLGMITFLVLGLSAVLYFSYRREMKACREFRLFVGDDRLVIHRAKLQDVEIVRTEITAITRTEGRGIVIQTGTRHRLAFVPEGMDDLDGLVSDLARLGEIQAGNRRRGNRLVAVTLLGVLVLYGLGYVALTNPNPLVARSCAVLVLAAAIYLVAEALRSRVYGLRFKLASLTLLVPALVVFAQAFGYWWR